MNNIIIHICGPSGSGKTYLGIKLKKYFKDKIVVKDLDTLFEEFMHKYYKNSNTFDEEKYQKYINAFIIKHINKPIVFVGLNDNYVNFLVTYKGKRKNIYYNLHSKYNYYIKLDDRIVAMQKCKRWIPIMKNVIDNGVYSMIYDTDTFVEIMGLLLKTHCNINQIIKLNNRWKRHYINSGYKYMEQKDILKDISNKLLRKV